MKSLIFTIILFISIHTNAQQNQEWVAFHSGVNYSREIAIENNTMWIATLGGLFRYDLNTGSSVKYDRTNSDMPYYEIRNLFVDNQGNKWFGYNNFIVKFDGNSFTKFNATDFGLSPFASLVKIKSDQQGNIWFAFSYGGLLKFNGSNWQSYTPSNSGLTYANAITDFDFDANGSIWIGSYGDFLFNFNGTSTTVYNYDNSGILSQHISAVVVDNQNNKWIGTPWGLQKFDNQNWVTYNSFNSGLPGNNITRLYLDKQNNLWIAIGYNNYIVKYNYSSWQVYDYLNSPVSADYVFKDDNNGNMWFAGYGKVFRFRNNDWSQHNNYSDFKSYSTITSFVQDSAGNYWFGTNYDGLVKFDGISWQQYNTSNSGLPSNRISGLSYNLQSGLWIATLDSGLANFNGNLWTVYNSSNSPLVSNFLNTIIVDNNNKKWIGTSGNGIQYISSNMNQWVNFTSNNSGLLYNGIRKLYFDNISGKLWIIPDISLYPPQSFDGLVWKSYDTLTNFQTGYLILKPITKIMYGLQQVPPWLN